MWYARLTADTASPPRFAATPPAAATSGASHSRGARLLLVAAVSYNLPLSILNAQVGGVDRNTVIGVEAVLMSCGLLLALTRWRPEMSRWLLMIITFFGLAMVFSLLREGFDPKSFRDMLMFAVFVMTGMLVSWRDCRRVLVALHIVVLVIMLVEVSFPEQYGGFVDPRSYFIASRGFTAEQLAGQTELFGAVRPDERYFLPELGWIRGSSMFLEPLSLGNYASFAVLAMLVFWRDWRWAMRGFMLVSTAVILVGSDGRFAGASIVVLLLAAPLLARLPAVLALLYLPVAVLVARTASLAFEWKPVFDTFAGRMARGMKQLFQLDGYDLAGFSVPTPALADSGIAYLVMAQSLPGVVVMQLFLYFQPQLRDPRQRLALHGTALTFALSILVSISMLSIKTAGFYWFFVGMMIVAAPRGATDLPDDPP